MPRANTASCCCRYSLTILLLDHLFSPFDMQCIIRRKKRDGGADLTGNLLWQAGGSRQRRLRRRQFGANKDWIYLGQLHDGRCSASCLHGLIYALHTRYKISFDHNSVGPPIPIRCINRCHALIDTYDFFRPHFRRYWNDRPADWRPIVKYRTKRTP